jgi:hypothetical protein
MKERYQSLIRLPGVGEVTADALYEAGYGSAADILSSTLEDLMQVPGVNEKKAENIMEAARLYLAKLNEEDAALAAPAGLDAAPVKSDTEEAAGAVDQPKRRMRRKMIARKTTVWRMMGCRICPLSMSGAHCVGCRSPEAESRVGPLAVAEDGRVVPTRPR